LHSRASSTPVQGTEVRFSASLLGADHGRIFEAAMAAKDAGLDFLHLDVMDGHFVKNLAFGPGVARALDGVGLPLLVHLMVAEPERWVERFAGPATAAITFHLEAAADARPLLARVRALGVRAGLALSPGTPFEAARGLLPCLDMVLLMGVNPGFGGQAFMPAVLPKIRAASLALRERRAGAWLEVDGGLGPATVGPVARAGASILALGSSLFGGGDVRAAASAIRAAAMSSAPPA
jgi:ribulose-phosphate 3-epimerase